jgi:YVTN family beta-propeller protein
MEADTRIGKELAGYRIESLIGRGGMSVVYLAEHLGLGRKVALKVLAPELSGEKGFRERFIRESRLAASIDHPNIIPIYDAGEQAGLLYIAMRYVEGTDLKAYLQEFGPLSPEKSISIVAQLASALDTAHARGLVHRDVKPGNVLIVAGIGEEGRDHAYLADFGLTKQALSVSGVTDTGQFVGTIDYCAPEQIEAKKVDGRADIYSLGCVLYECLTGSKPYHADAEVAVLWAHIQAKPPSATARRPDLPSGIDRVIAKAMAKSPEDRYQKAGELAAAARAELGVTSGEHPVLLPVWRRDGGTRRRVVLGGVGALLAVLAVVVFLLTRGGGSPVFPTGPNTVAIIDPATNEVVDGVRVGEGPQSIAFGEHGVWVANYSAKTIERKDPQTKAERANFSADDTPTGVAAGAGSVWVTTSISDSVRVVDPRLNKITDTVTIPSAEGVAVGAGQVWVTSPDDNALFRIDPQTHDYTRTTVGKKPEGVAVGMGGVWVANSLGSSVTRVDPATGKVNAGSGSIAIGCQPDQVAVGAGAVWVTCSPNQLAKIDPSTNSLSNTTPACAGAVGVAVTDGAVWLACSQESQVWRIDPRTGDVVKRIPVKGSPQRIAIVGGRIWVTVGSP